MATTAESSTRTASTGNNDNRTSTESALFSFDEEMSQRPSDAGIAPVYYVGRKSRSNPAPQRRGSSSTESSVDSTEEERRVYDSPGMKEKGEMGRIVKAGNQEKVKKLKLGRLQIRFRA